MIENKVKILSKMKKLICEGNRRFQLRKDHDYLKDLLELGISEEEAWQKILELNINFLKPDWKKPYYSRSLDTLVFEKVINGENAYIKLKIEKNIKNEEETVCLSFHKNR